MAAVLLTLLIAILLIGFTSFLSRRLARQDKDEEAKGAQLAKLHQRVCQLEELIHSWRRRSDNPDVAYELYQLALESLDRIAIMDTSNAFAATEQERLLPLIQDPPLRGSRNTPVLKSKAELARLKTELKEIKRILHARANSALLTEAQYQRMCSEIDWVGTQAAMDSHLGNAREAFANADAAAAVKYLNKAERTLESTQSADPRLTEYAVAIEKLQKELPVPAIVND